MERTPQKILDEVYDLIEGLENVHGLIKKETEKEISALFANLAPPDIADLIDGLDVEKARFVFEILQPPISSEVIRKVNDSTREDLLKELSQDRLVRIIGEMESDDAADLIRQLPPDRAQGVLGSLEKKHSEEIRELLKYEEDTAGGLMELEIVAVNQGATVGEAIEAIRKAADQMENIYNVYVVDPKKRLVGVLPLGRLILARSEQKVSEIMNRDVISVRQGTDQEDVANIFQKYDLSALPVVDEDGKLVGRITVDDIVDVIQEEASEDISKMAGTTEDEITERSSLKIAGIRLPWIITSLVGGIVSASILSSFKETLGQLLALAFFIPVITAMGGNIGVQSASITVRGIALGDINPAKISLRLLREGRVGLVMGFICGSVIGIVALAWEGSPVLGIVVGTAMFCAINVAAIMGTLVPLIFKRIGVDPAIATGPFVTMSNDITGLLIYFGMATLMLRWLR
ncbi:MAG TPA: magnesium transporter [Candidatus Latescibacteria bacterium]|nr:magnesium transporter [Candidatus Latescibacterota bacterium]